MMVPGLSSYVNKPLFLLEKIYLFIFLVTLVYLPIVYICMCWPELVILTIFGKHWTESIELFRLFSIITYCSIIYMALANVYTIFNKVKLIFYIDVVLLFIYFISVFYIPYTNMINFAIARVIYYYLSLLVSLYFIRSFVPLSVIYLLKMVFPLLAISIISLLITNYIFENPELGIFMLIKVVSFYFSIYIFQFLILVRVVNFPEFKKINNYVHHFLRFKI
jgi:O-antigen/teichoic acid export membrane protein